MHNTFNHIYVVLSQFNMTNNEPSLCPCKYCGKYPYFSTYCGLYEIGCKSRKCDKLYKEIYKIHPQFAADNQSAVIGEDKIKTMEKWNEKNEKNE